MMLRLPRTDKLWIYDFRTNRRFTLKARALARTDLGDFVTRYNPANRHERTETERFRAFSHDELMAAATSQNPRANEAVGPKQRGATDPAAVAWGCARAKKRPAAAFRRRRSIM
jgi:hypothetical protein